MITVSVRAYYRLHNPPRGFKPGRRFELAVEENKTVAELVNQLLGIAENRPEMIIAVNGRVVISEDYILQAQDRVDLFPLVAGG